MKNCCCCSRMVSLVRALDVSIKRRRKNGDRREGRGEGTYSSAGGKGLDDAALLVGLEDLVDGVLALHHLDLVAEPLAGELDDAAAGDAVEDEAVVEGGGDELELAVAVLGAPDDKEVAGAGLGAEALGAVEPQDLAEAAGAGLVGGEQRGAVVGADLCVAEAADPGAHHVLGVGVQAHAAGGRVHAGHEAGGDEEEGLLGGLDAELGLGADDGGAEVEEGARAGAGQPLGAVDRDELVDELLELGGLEAGQGDAEGAHEHALGVEVGAEEAELAVEAAEDLEALEALGRVVQDRGGGHEAEGPVGLELGGGPAGRVLPAGRDHVVGADGLEAGVGGGLVRHLAGGRVGELVGELGGVEVLDLGGGAVAVGVAIAAAVGSYPALESRGREVGGLGHHR